MELFRLLGTIKVNNDTANTAIDDTTDKASESEGKMSGSFQKIGSAALTMATVVGTAAAAAGTALTKAAVEGYADYEQLVGGVDTLFKNSSKKVQEYANIAYQSAGLSANDYMETVTSFSASLLQSLGGNTEEAAEMANMAIIDMSDNANKMGTDMSMIQNAYNGFAKQNYTMLDNLKLGYGGTKEEMARLLQDAEALKAASGEQVDYHLSNFADVVDAIHVIQDNIGITGTTAKEASTTIQGSISAMKGAWKNLLVGIAAGDQDTASLFKNLYNSATKVAENLLPRVKTTIAGFGNLIATLLPVDKIQTAISNGIPKITKAGANLLNKFGESLKNNLPVVIEKGLDIVLNLSNTIKENAPKLIQSGLKLIVNLANGLMDSLPTMLAKVPTIVSNFANVINENAPSLLVTAGKLMLTIGTGLIKAIPTLVANIPKIIKAVIDAFLAGQWLSAGKTVIQKFVDGFKGKDSVVKSAAEKIKTLIKEQISKLPESLKTQGKKAMDNLVSKLKSVTSLKTAANSIKNTVVNVIKTIPDKLKTYAKNAVSNLVSKFKSISSLETAVKNIKTKIVDVIKTIPTKLKSLGGDAIDKLKTGIVNKKDALVDKIKSIVSSLKNLFNFTFSIPKIKLPHFSIQPSGWKIGDLLKGEIPSLGISWYAKGAVFEKPTILSTASGLKGVGEAGSEAVAPIAVLQSYVAEAVRAENSGLQDKLDSIVALLVQYLPQISMNRQLVLDTGVLAGELVVPMDKELGILSRRKERGR